MKPKAPTLPAPRRLAVFNQVSLDGYICDAKGDMSWAHRGGNDPEWQAFTAGNARSDAVLVFGRVTYDLMARFWPSPGAEAGMPDVARRMNGAEKIVFSRSMKKAAWANTRVAKRGPVAEIRRLKSEPGADLTVLGSGSVVAQLADAGLIDYLMVVVVPLVLGAGKTMFEGAKKRPEFTLVSSRAFQNGNALLCYTPKR